MTEGLTNKAESLGNYTYFYDGTIRRRLHEYGTMPGNFYHVALQLMDYQPHDIVLDIGAGMGHDGLHVACNYHPRLIFLLEPHFDTLTEFDDKYYPLVDEIKKRGIKGIEVLPSPGSEDRRMIVQPEVQEEELTYMQPLDAVAEDIKHLANNSVTKLSIIHSAYEFTDLKKALSEVARVLAPDGMGVLITNGEGDKQVFKEMLRQAGEYMRTDAPRTVSAKLNYLQARLILKEYFEDVSLCTYQDQMVIYEGRRLDDYDYSFNSYRRFFARPRINEGQWLQMKAEVFDNRIRSEMLAHNGIFKDTIDIGAIYFQKPLK